MKIAFNPSTVEALIAPPNNKDITFDLRGQNIFARGVKFCGTDTNTWRDIKINNVSIDSNTLDLRDGSNTTLTNINGVVTINSTWRPVVDNLTSDSTTSSLSANQGRVLKALIDGKSDSGHNHDGRYLRLNGSDTMQGNLYLHSYGTSYIGRGSGDKSGADFTEANIVIRSWWGISFKSNDDIVRTYIDTRTGNIGTKGVLNVVGAVIQGRVYNGGDDEGIIVKPSPNGYAGLILGAHNGERSVFYFTKGNPFWRYNNGSTNLDILHPKKSGTIALTSDIPTSLKNPYSLTTFGVVYDGSSAKTVTTSNFISLVTEGTSTITDGTMFITSYASNNGFADTNAVNVPYKRKAIHLWEYVKAKTDSLYATKGHNHDDRYVRAFGTSNDNIDSDWGLSFKTFDPIPSGTPPELNPNISILNIGENFDRRKLLAFIYNNDNIYYRRHVDGGFTNWRRLAFANEIPTSLPANGGNADTTDGVHITWAGLLTSTSHLVAWEANGSALRDINPANVTVGNSDKLDGYHASSLWRSDGATWNPGANVSLTASGNNQEWSFDIGRNGYTGCFWQVWDSALNTLLKVNADDGKVYAPYNFVGNLEGNATTSTKSEYSRSLLGRNTSGNDYDTNSANLVFAEWNTMSDNRWYLKATGYECRVAYANSAGSASKVYGQVGDTGSHELVRCDMNNDQFRIIAGSNGNNNGWAEIATADDGNEPIYVRQYTGVFSSVVRTLTLLDANGYTHFPSYINIGGNENNNSSPDRVWGSNSSDSYLRSYRTSALSVANADTVDGVHIQWTGELTSTNHLVAWEADGSALRDINPANISVGYASSAGNADTLDSYHASSGSNTPWGTIPVITTLGFMEIGKNLEFHYDNTTGSDYSTALMCQGNYSNIVYLPSASGTLALTSNIPTVTNYYWANVKISASTSTTTSPTVLNLTATSSIKMGNILLEHTDEINNSTNGYLHLNYRNSGNISLCQGGGNVGIGTTSPAYKLDVNGDIWCRGALRVGSSATNNYIAFYGNTGDAPGSFVTSFIGEHLWGGDESTELLLMKFNDVGNGINGTTVSGPGPDRIRHIAHAHVFLIMTDTSLGDFATMAATTAVETKLDITRNRITASVPLYLQSDLHVAGNIYSSRQIVREGQSTIWAYGRSVALLRETSAPGYHTLWSLKTTNGSWDFGEYNTSGWYNVPVLSYITDSNYNSGNNVTTYQIKFPLASGTVALTSYGGDNSHPIFLGYLNLDHGNDGTVSSSFYCLGYSVPFTYTRGGNYCKISIPDTSYQVFYIKAAIASVNYSGGGMDTWTGNRRGDGSWWLHCYASGSNEVRVKGFRQKDTNNDSWWGGNPLIPDSGGANRITVCIFGYVTFR